MLYVATDGNDAWSGRLPATNASRSDGPCATLQRARAAIRQLKQAGPPPEGGVALELAGGIYSLAQPLELAQQDSGTEKAPIEYRGRKGAKVHLIVGKLVTDWRPVTDPAVLAGMNEAARTHVFQADLKDQGVTDFGEMRPRPTLGPAGPRVELFFDDEPMTLPRWPNQGFVYIVDLLGTTPANQGDERLLGSSEVLESLIGKWKHVAGEEGRHGFTGMILSLGALVGKLTVDAVWDALAEVPTRDVWSWCQTHLGSTVQSIRVRIRHALTPKQNSNHHPLKTPDVFTSPWYTLVEKMRSSTCSPNSRWSSTTLARTSPAGTSASHNATRASRTASVSALVLPIGFSSGNRQNTQFPGEGKGDAKPRQGRLPWPAVSTVEIWPLFSYRLVLSEL